MPLTNLNGVWCRVGVGHSGCTRCHWCTAPYAMHAGLETCEFNNIWRATHYILVYNTNEQGKPEGRIYFGDWWPGVETKWKHHGKESRKCIGVHIPHPWWEGSPRTALKGFRFWLAQTEHHRLMVPCFPLFVLFIKYINNALWKCVDAHRAGSKATKCASWECSCTPIHFIIRYSQPQISDGLPKVSLQQNPAGSKVSLPQILRGITWKTGEKFPAVGRPSPVINTTEDSFWTITWP